ncbi:MAG: TldD/PmbA family protein, partial [Candidatus Micrarchaeota archaeon]|nr:TldD/PmbA family protein [Candidatus Micrarchaeota archaeon]
MADGQALAEYAVALAERRGFGYGEAYFEQSSGTGYAIEQGRLNSSSYFEKSGLRIRLLKEGRMYVFSTNILEKDAIRNAIEGFRRFESSRTQLSRESPQKAKVAVKERKKFDKERLLKDLLSLDKTLASKRYIKFRSLYAGFGKDSSFMTNSDGSSILQETPRVDSTFSIIVGKGKETRQRMSQFGGVGGYEMLNIQRIEEQLLGDSKAMLDVIEKGVRLSDSELRKIENVVISPEIAGIAVHESVGHPNEADRVFMREAAQAGTSYVNPDNLGLSIGSEHVTIVDDPTIPNSFGFYKYDDEGVRAGAKQIVSRGNQNELLNNREYAKILNTKSNGSARSDSYSNEPIVRMSNTYLKKGSASFEELVGEAGNGVYIKNFMEWNIDDTRTFSRYQGNEAYMIKNGSVE